MSLSESKPKVSKYLIGSKCQKSEESGPNKNRSEPDTKIWIPVLTIKQGQLYQIAYF